MPNQDISQWRQQLNKAIGQNATSPHSRFFQLATVAANQHPACRTVVFRGFVDNTDTLIAHTDVRSEKIQQLSSNPHAQVCWYFSASREQFRLSSEITMLTGQEPHAEALRLAQWQALSAQAKNTYNCAVPGSALLIEQTPGTTADKDCLAEEKPSDNFALLLISPNSVDHLLLRPSPQQRTLYHQQGDGSWSVESVTA
jgi:pyridoxamine 5'-phosphate oxidase